MLLLNFCIYYAAVLYAVLPFVCLSVSHMQALNLYLKIKKKYTKTKIGLDVPQGARARVIRSQFSVEKVKGQGHRTLKNAENWRRVYLRRPYIVSALGSDMLSCCCCNSQQTYYE